jgi:flavin reductase (DIM6/NTAB) family NADH-FMN oxidoreductase RutF
MRTLPESDLVVTPTVDSAAFREVLGHFCSGVTVLSSVVDGRPAGMTCQSFFSVSLDPSMVAFSVARTSTTFPQLVAAGAVCVNILASDQAGVSDAFAQSGTDKWAGVDWSRSKRTGHPKIKGALAWIECEISDIIETGDHLLVLASVLELSCRHDLCPLLFFRGRYIELQHG